MTRLRPGEGLFWYTDLMKSRDINLEKLVLDNYSTEEVLKFCVENLIPYMDIERLSDKYIYWQILEELNNRVNGQKRAKVM